MENIEEITQQDEQRYAELCGKAFEFARHDEKEELQKMIEAGLSVNLKNEKGDSLIMLASYRNSLETVKMLIEKGARVDERNDKNQTPLAGACFKGHLEVVKALVEAGADINANNGMGATPHTFAMIFGRTEVVKYLNSVNKKQGFLQKTFGKIFGLFSGK